LEITTGSLGAIGAFTASVTWAFASANYAKMSESAGAVRVNLLRALVAASLWLSALGVIEGPASLAAVGAPQALLLAGSIACSYAVGDAVFFAAARRAGLSVAMAIATIYPLWAALYGALFRGEAFGTFRVLGLLACIVGIAALLVLTHKARLGPQQGAMLGIMLAFLTSLFWAGNAVFLKLGADGLSFYQTNAVRFSFGALFLLIQLPLQRRSESKQRVDMWQLGAKLWLPLLVDTGLGSVCFAYGITHTDLALGATLSSLSPLVALPIAAAMGSERVTLGKAMAVSVTVLGIVLLVSAPG
jgi:DME family drug/metabolite transporter